MEFTETYVPQTPPASSGSREPTGLSIDKAAKRLRQYGRNRIEREKEKSVFLIFFRQFHSSLVYILLFASGMSFFFGEWLDGFAILAVIFINTCTGFYMEYKADRSMEALKKLATVSANVVRDGVRKEINSEEVVPGDVIFTEAGDMVPADAEIIRSSQLLADEASLTGESVPVEKQAGEAARGNLLFKGTSITKGNAYARVISTGMNTELGKIAHLVQSASQSATPLEKKLQEFTKMLIGFTTGIVTVIFITGLLNGHPLAGMLQTSIALAVAAIPEGLPIVATLSLAQGMLKMARHQVIVKKLSSVETLGGTTVICTDKTGTLTRNRIEVSETVTYDPDRMLQVAVLCSTATLGPDGKETGDPLETGLLKYAKGKGIDIEAMRRSNPVQQEEPFSSETKIMSVQCQTKEGQLVLAKGAVEELLKRCSHVPGLDGKNPGYDGNRNGWLEQAEKLAASGFRVIGAAYNSRENQVSGISRNLTFSGIFAMIDPPREDVFDAIRECKSAGIQVVMVTGDHPSTAKTVARTLGIVGEENDEVVSGNDMKEHSRLTPEERQHWLRARVFARVSPQQKLDLVHVLQDEKNVVAMTGDGVNDAPALKKADIGIAMGINGTQVAQEVADMVLQDNSFASIVRAVKQGRTIFENIRKSLTFLLSCNISELLIISVVYILDLHFQLFPLQILFINLITDVLPALALGFTEGSGKIMSIPPRAMSEPLLGRKSWRRIFYYAIVITAVSLASVFISHYTVHMKEPFDPLWCNNILFFTLIFAQLFHVFNMGDKRSSFFRNEVIRNKHVWLSLLLSVLILGICYALEPVRNVLDIHPMTAYDWIISAGMGMFSFVIVQAFRKRKRKNN